MRLTLACLAFALAPFAAMADPFEAQARTSAITIESEILGEDREIFVRTPPYYDAAKKYPVVYVLDGESKFDIVAAQFEFLMDNYSVPPVIVTAVRNVNRNRDYLTMEEPGFRDTGGGEAFANFVAEEWIPAIEQAHPGARERILVGHSFGGVFAVNTFLTTPELFDAYIAISTSGWVGEYELVEKSLARFEEGVPDGRFVYMAPGEFDGGPTRPSGEQIAEAFKKHAPDNLDWTFELIPDADHFRALTIGFSHAVTKLFPVANFSPQAVAAAEAGGPDGVNAWFDKTTEKLGFRFYPSWFDFGVAAMVMSRGEHIEAAVAMIEETLPYHEDNALFLAFAATVHENAGDFDKALATNGRAIALVKERNLHPNSMHLERLTEAAARIRSKQQDMLSDKK
ncbi:MAG: hypothetical protein KJN99_04095 [Marinicaulis sp.]|nr:hypothetical protein [Marinicaulis sp.]